MIDISRIIALWLDSISRAEDGEQSVCPIILWLVRRIGQSYCQELNLIKIARMHLIDK